MVKQVEFNGDILLAVKDNETNKIHVAVYYVCRGLGLSDGQMKNERVRIQDDIVLSKGGRKIILPTNGGSQEALCIEIDYLPLWLAKINANIIQDKAVQDKLIEYQLEAKDVLATAFLGQTQPQFNIPQTLPEALRLAADLAEENAKLLPKANSFDTFINSEGNLTIEETAKTLNIKGIGRNKLFQVLAIEKILFKKGDSYEAYQNYINSGYFIHKQNPIKKGDVIEQRTQVFVTPKGLDWLSKKMKERSYMA
nr:phage antirepressor KilAC domain-containing protein [Ruminiclostridium hungatei]